VIWLVAALVVVALLAASAAFIWTRRRRIRRLPKPRPPKLHHPVVLAHGIFGFDRIIIGGRDHSYFRGVRDHLIRVGAEVHRPRVSAAANIAVRAEELARVVRAIPRGPGDGKINIIAHSMGGLDARYAIAKLGLADRVAALVTVGTPHLGTPVADLGSKLSHMLKLKPLFGRLSLDGFHDLGTLQMSQFNSDVANVPGVAYASVIARIDRPRAHPLLWPTHAYLSQRIGPNDGMVPTVSQAWGEVWREIEADHWAQIGWTRGNFDALSLYEEILRLLRDRGF
jgi:triacylglycerol lipase